MSLGTDVGRFALVPMWVAEALAENPTALRLFIVLAGNYADRDTGECFPKRDTLAADLGVSEPTVSKAARDLMAAEALTVERRGRASGAGGRTSNLYRLHFAHPTYRKSSTPLSESPLSPSPTGTAFSETDPLNESAAPPAPADSLPSQGGLWGQEERDRLQVFKDLIAEHFNNRRGDRGTRERMARHIRRGATVQQFRRAIEITKEATRDDPVKFAVGVLARMVEEGDDGTRSDTEAGGGAGSGARGFGSGGGSRTGTGNGRGHGDRRGAAAAGAGGTSSYEKLW